MEKRNAEAVNGANGPRFQQQQGLALEKLAGDISELTRELVERLDAHGARQPDFGTRSPTALWEDKSLRETKTRLIDTAKTLVDLVNGPMNFHRDWFGSHFDLAVHQAMLELKVYDHIPLEGGPVGLQELSDQVKIDPARLARMLRLLQTIHMVDEPAPGSFQHTAYSAVLVTDKELRAQVEMQMDEMFKASAETANYFLERGFSTESHDSPFKHKWGAPFYEWYEGDPVRAARFALAQEGITKLGRSFEALSHWISTSGLVEGTLIDVGGGSGYVALDLAKEFPFLNFVVQDLSETMFAETSQSASPTLLKQVSFIKHDFFEPQPVPPSQEVKAWYIRSCLHNWGDEDCVRILKQFVPAMEARPDCSLLINETITPTHGTVPLYEEHKIRRLDMAMMVIANAKQRSEADFRALIHAADPRYKVTRVVHSPGTMGVIEVQLGSE